jgi:hypothetical protein
MFDVTYSKTARGADNEHRAAGAVARARQYVRRVQTMEAPRPSQIPLRSSQPFAGAALTALRPTLRAARPLDARADTRVREIAGRESSAPRPHTDASPATTATDLDAGASAVDHNVAFGRGKAAAQVGDALATPGRPLDPATRRRMEAGFGFEFSSVRIHDDARAAAAAAGINAAAFTLGQDVVFGAGRYAPSTGEGHELLAHELAHTIQQRDATVKGPDVAPDSMLERCAAAAGRAAANGASVSQSLGQSRLAVARQPADDDLDWVLDELTTDERDEFVRYRDYGKSFPDNKSQIADERFAQLIGYARRRADSRAASRASAEAMTWQGVSPISTDEDETAPTPMALPEPAPGKRPSKPPPARALPRHRREPASTARFLPGGFTDEEAERVDKEGREELSHALDMQARAEAERAHELDVSGPDPIVWGDVATEYGTSVRVQMRRSELEAAQDRARNRPILEGMASIANAGPVSTAGLAVGGTARVLRGGESKEAVPSSLALGGLGDAFALGVGAPPLPGTAADPAPAPAAIVGEAPAREPVPEPEPLAQARTAPEPSATTAETAPEPVARAARPPAAATPAPSPPEPVDRRIVTATKQLADAQNAAERASDRLERATLKAAEAARAQQLADQELAQARTEVDAARIARDRASEAYRNAEPGARQEPRKEFTKARNALERVESNAKRAEKKAAAAKTALDAASAAVEQQATSSTELKVKAERAQARLAATERAVAEGTPDRLKPGDTFSASKRRPSFGRNGPRGRVTRGVAGGLEYGAEVRIFKDPFKTAKQQAELQSILKLAEANPQRAGNEFAKLTGQIEGWGDIAESFRAVHGAIGRRWDFGNVKELTIEGREGALSESKLDQLWFDLNEHGSIDLTVPMLSSEAEGQLARLAGEWRKWTGRDPLILVRETAR